MDIHSQNPIARRRDEAQRPYRSRLPARAILPFALTDDALDAARWSKRCVQLYLTPLSFFAHASPRCLGYCPTHANSPGSASVPPLRVFSLAARRSRATEIVACPQMHLHRFQTVPSCARPSAPSIFHGVHRSSPKRRPTLASPLSSSNPAFLLARRRRALSHR
jgi:hypothetical protein